jgi:hypothetical protein
MLKTIQLPRHDLIMLDMLLENKAADLAKHIEEVDYEKLHQELAPAVLAADNAYLNDIRAVQYVINKAIGE